MLVCCPVHQEKNASCSIHIASDSTVAFRCHGCGATGDVFTLIAAVHGLDVKRDFRDVLRLAAQMAGHWEIVDALDGRHEYVAPARVVPEPTAEVIPSDVDAILRRMLELCPLSGRPDACEYLAARGIFPDAQAVGVAALPYPDDQGAVIDALTSEFGAAALIEAGQFKAGRVFWSEQHPLLIPWQSRTGRLLSVQRRTLESSASKKYLFPFGRSMPREVFGADLFDESLAFWRRAGEAPLLTLVEGPLDALALRALNRHDGTPEPRIILGIPSASVWLPSVLELARGLDVSLAFDADEAGDRAAVLYGDKLVGIALNVFRDRPRGAKDAGEMLKRCVA